MVGNYGLSGFSRHENFGILTSNHESNVGNFFGIFDKNDQNSGIFCENHHFSCFLHFFVVVVFSQDFIYKKCPEKKNCPEKIFHFRN